MIYFVRAGESGPVKIGTADDVADRLRELQCGNHEPLALIREVDGGQPIERWFHRYFAAHRLRGEWFRFHPEMLTVTAPEIAPLVRLSKLEDFITQAGISVEEFAAKIGTSREAVCTYMRRTRIPRVKQMAAIVRETAGYVTANDFYDVPAASKIEAAQ